MSMVAERHVDLASVQSGWQGLNKLVPLGPITGERDYKRRVRSWTNCSTALVPTNRTG